MALETLQSLAVPAATAITGGYILALCVTRLRSVIVPQVKHRFSAAGGPHRFVLPAAGRYTICVVIPPLTFFAGTSHFSAWFAITNRDTGAPSDYRSHRRALFQVRRSDMRGRRIIPLGSFKCEAPGRFEIVCRNPDVIRQNFELEISPHISPIRLVALVLATIASSTVLIGGVVLSALRFTGTI